MEDKLFKFDSLDGDCVKMKYFDVTLNEKIGEFEPGSKFDVATINFEKGWLSLYNVSENEQRIAPEEVLVGRYQIALSVVRDLLNDD